MKGPERIAGIVTGQPKHAALRRVAVMSCWVGLAALVAGCSGQSSGSPRAAGLPYDARLSAGETWRDFTVLVRAPGLSLADIRESARFAATLHCIERTGNSAVDWASDPATGDWQVTRSASGEPIVAGRCAAR